MQSLPLADVTRRMAPPKGWDHARDGICHTLEICDRDGWMTSAWRFEPAELRRVAAGAPLFLHIQGSAHPVVGLSIGTDANATAPLARAEIHELVYVRVLLELTAPGLTLAIRSSRAIAANCARRISAEIEARLAGLPPDSSGT
jgi:hypothetical protein